MPSDDQADVRKVGKEMRFECADGELNMTTVTLALRKASNPRQLAVCVARARGILAKAETCARAREIRAEALAVERYAKARGDAVEAASAAGRIALWAERRMGQILAKTVEHGGGRPGKQCNRATVKDHGLTREESSRFQKLALVSEGEFEVIIAETPTREAVLKAQRKRAAEAREREAVKTADTTDWTVTPDQAIIPCHALVTDPPYGILDETWEPDRIEAFTREWASRWNGCGADSVAVFFSQRFLWDGRRWFDESLADYAFRQLLVWHYPNNIKPQSRMGFKQTWEPVFLYRRLGTDRPIQPSGSEWGDGLNTFDCHVAAVPQSNFTGAERKVHPAQKPVSVFRWLVNALTVPGETVADPFCGSGTCGIASRQLHRSFHGIETDPAYLQKAKERIAAYGNV